MHPKDQKLVEIQRRKTDHMFMLDPEAIDMEEAIDKLCFTDLVVLKKTLEGYSGTEIARLFKSITGKGSKQYVYTVKKRIQKKFMECAKCEDSEMDSLPK